MASSMVHEAALELAVMGTGLHTKDRRMGHPQLDNLIVDSGSSSIEWRPISAVVRGW